MTPDRYLDALLGLPRISAAQVSPDGRWVAWTWSNTGPAADVFAAPTDGSSTPIRLTETPHDTILTSWTPDSRAVVVAQDRDGDERAQLFLVTLDKPGVMRPLTEPAPPYFLRGGQLHPNGRWLVYGAKHGLSSRNCHGVDPANGAAHGPRVMVSPTTMAMIGRGKETISALSYPVGRLG